MRGPHRGAAKEFDHGRRSQRYNYRDAPRDAGCGYRHAASAQRAKAGKRDLDKKSAAKSDERATEIANNKPPE